MESRGCKIARNQDQILLATSEFRADWPDVAVQYAGASEEDMTPTTSPERLPWHSSQRAPADSR